MLTKSLLHILKRRDHLGDIFVDGRIILKRILKKWVERRWNGFIWLSIEQSGVFM
jgi:hypothetical protein